MTATFFFFFFGRCTASKSSVCFSHVSLFILCSKQTFLLPNSSLCVCVCVCRMADAYLESANINIFPVPHSKTQVRAIGSTFGQKSLGEASCFSDLGLGGHYVSHQPFFLA